MVDTAAVRVTTLLFVSRWPLRSQMCVPHLHSIPSHNSRVKVTLRRLLLRPQRDQPQPHILADLRPDLISQHIIVRAKTAQRDRHAAETTADVEDCWPAAVGEVRLPVHRIRVVRVAHAVVEAGRVRVC